MVSNHREAAQAAPSPRPPPPLRQPRHRLSKFRGVRKRRWGRWVAEIRVPKSCDRLWLGSYSNPYQAARAYDVAATCLRGPTAARNLPNHAVPQPAQRCLTLASIRAFAMHEATRFNVCEEQQLQQLGPPYTASLAQTHPPLAPLLSEQSSLRKAQPSLIPDQRVNCSPDSSLDYHFACLTEQLDKHQICSTELQGFQDLVPTELHHTTHSCSQAEAPRLLAEPQSAQKEHLDCEETHTRDQPLSGPTSLLDFWFCLDIGSAVHPSLKALLRHSLYPENRQG